LTRRVTLEDMYAFTLMPSPGSPAKDRYGLLEIGPVGGEKQSFELHGSGDQYLFRDINADGYVDFTVGQIREEDHSGEYNFFYHPDLARFIAGPDILQGNKPYSFDAETGYALVGDPEREITLYAFDAEGTFRALRRMTRTQENGKTHLTVRMIPDMNETGMPEEADAQETVLLDDTLSGEALDEAEILFRSEIVWQTMLQDDTGGSVLVTKRNSSDIIRPLEAVRIYVLDKEGRLRGCRELEPTENRLLYAEAQETDPDGFLTEDSTLTLRFLQEAETEGEEEQEQVVTVKMRELLAETEP
ncbi:MAG: hypothetical protein II868_02615, partial [Butyrivibrio sp.]|nr:hypothetical protein [Butyrivibrio sp.]